MRIKLKNYAYRKISKNTQTHHRSTYKPGEAIHEFTETLRNTYEHTEEYMSLQKNT